VVTDLSPLRRGRRLRAEAAERLERPLIEVDTEHVVPLRLIGREHWAARTLRPVIQRLLSSFLIEPEVGGVDGLANEARRPGLTHDVAWNAAQTELRRWGRIHPYLRMYWGKKLIEWTPNAVTALRIALELNDRYALDGRSANGVANIQWCFGRHDRPWPERPIFGTVRTMTASGLRRKLDVEGYIRSAVGEAPQPAWPCFVEGRA
jgi:hypothetical protein